MAYILATAASIRRIARRTAPAQNGILFGKSGDKIGTLTLLQVRCPTLSVINNPLNPVYKLLLVMGCNSAEMRQAAWQLISTPLAGKTGRHQNAGESHT
ncbi:hypothetical protein BG74_01075 [Sodalis-like endosymbiont of Proechinophthirus fluctus]|uniref:cellulose biosynthesis cyclic di-GMP-binding regulatory protein BcsB n=1 Tax=Sodalis-like endosymbiont of Proechinophthirus fluctus TaxID=1462730 RepID=UPI0007A835CE|nr:cellulose biosynthesis cyclic di-GMP-binding regulatory protein BcsB [Sodalis-like endosymbiont of Proechinophthirus fluctus]KYP97710.1 hypothetical protein BG74_01075 [Sodalis-like endosymbiont of Proechinophthirus fluctus]